MRCAPDTSPPDIHVHEDSIFCFGWSDEEEDVDKAEDALLPDWTMLSVDCLVAIRLLIVSF